MIKKSEHNESVMNMESGFAIQINLSLSTLLGSHIWYVHSLTIFQASLEWTY